MIGFGASPLGDVFGRIDPEQGRAAVAYAIEQGMNFFDVAPYYGRTLAEERLGAALLGCRERVVLATKCGRYGVDAFDFSASAITENLEQSLRRLRTDYVDLLQVHDVEFASIDQVLHETLPAMRQLQQQGKVRFLGITGYWPGLLAHIAETAATDTVLNYCHFNLLMDDMDRALTPLTDRLGIGLINASPLHMGLLAGAEAPAWHPAPPSVRAAAFDVAALCRSSGVKPGTVAVRACLEHPRVASTLVGLRSISEVDSALAALTFDLPEGLLPAIQQRVSPVRNTVWPSGLPANQPSD